MERGWTSKLIRDTSSPVELVGVCTVRTGWVSLLVAALDAVKTRKRNRR